MAPSPVAVSNEIEVLRHQARVTQRVMRLNVEAISHEESLIQPQPAGNCLNWVIGHLVFAYELIFPLLGKPVMGEGRLKPYARHSSPLKDSAEAVPLQELLVAFDKASERVDAGLAGLATKKLDEPAAALADKRSEGNGALAFGEYLVPSGLSRGANGTSSPSRWQAWGNCLSRARL